jgi:1-acyl-sn-glycerol-3-phosphate acyltransferase
MARPRGVHRAPFAEVGASLGLSLRNVYETLEISWPTVLQALGGRLTKAICDQRLESWSRAVVENARIALEVRGRENLERDHTYLVMSNHQSLYDIPVLFHVIGPNVRMITKKELFAIPIFGGALAAAGFVSIDRSDRQRAIESLDRARGLLASGTHVWISPEGTRSPSGQLLPFKKGAFYLAFVALLPILPVTLRGTRDVLAARGVLSTTGAEVTVTIHPRIDPAPYAARGNEGRTELMQRLRDVLETGL